MACTRCTHKTAIIMNLMFYLMAYLTIKCVKGVPCPTYAQTAHRLQLLTHFCLYDHFCVKLGLCDTVLLNQDGPSVLKYLHQLVLDTHDMRLELLCDSLAFTLEGCHLILLLDLDGQLGRDKWHLINDERYTIRGQC